MTYQALPKVLEIKNSPVAGQGVFAKEDISTGTALGVSHLIIDDIIHRTPLGGFYNHSNEPTVIRMVSDVLPKLKFGDPVDPNANTKQLKDGKNDRENMFFNLNEKSDAKYMFMVSIKDIITIM